MCTKLLLTILVAIIGVILTVHCNPTNINDLKSHLPPELANTNLTIEDAKKLLKDKCQKLLGEEESEKVVLEIEEGSQVMIECLSEIVNVTSLQLEIDQARPIGELDTVFVKYCGKKDAAIQCVENYYEKITPCLDSQEKAGSAVIRRVIHSLFSFVCYKGGDQIALFYAEKGPECLQQNKEHISGCMNSTFGSYVPKEGLPDVTSLQFFIGPKQCKEINSFESCVLDGLDLCEEVTASNIVESMFRYVKNETDCPIDLESRRGYSKSSSTIFTTLSLISFIILVLIQRNIIS